MKIPMDKVIGVQEGIFTKVELLKKNPNLGQKEELLSHLSYTYRRLIYKHFKIVYRNEKISFEDFTKELQEEGIL